MPFCSYVLIPLFSYVVMFLYSYNCMSYVQLYFFSQKMNTLKGTLSRSKSPPPQRPPPPRNIEISGPMQIKPIVIKTNCEPIKKQVSRPTRPPPKLSQGANDVSKANNQPRPSRPKDRESVAQWWREVEFDKGSGVDSNGEVLNWFHGKFIQFFLGLELQGCLLIQLIF